jgi:hypothetical protein
MAKKTGVLKADKAQAKAQAKATRKENVAAVAKVVNPAKVKVASSAAGVRPEFDPQARIVVLPAGKENPRREGSARWVRYRDLMASKTVGEFLKKHPRWNSTVTRCVIAKLIELR